MNYYLYRHIRLDKYEPFYIGIGTKDNKFTTIKTEYARSYSKCERNDIWNKIVSKSDYKVEILLESNDYNFIKQKEIEFIKLYGRKNLNKGSLANLTDGGDGTINIVVTDETKKRISQKLKGNKPWNTGTKGIKPKNSGSFKKGMTAHNKTELSLEDKLEIRRLYYSKELTQKEFLRKYKTSHYTLMKIIKDGI